MALFGDDLLFARFCLHRGIRLWVRIPFDIPEFLMHSVTLADEGWRDRVHAMKDNPLAAVLVMPAALGPTREKHDPHVRNYLWQLCNALARGPEKVQFICHRNRQGGDRPDTSPQTDIYLKPSDLNLFTNFPSTPHAPSKSSRTGWE